MIGLRRFLPRRACLAATGARNGATCSSGRAPRRGRVHVHQDDRFPRRLTVIRPLYGENDADKYKLLTPDDRRAVIEILGETKTHLPEYFRVE